MEPRNLLQEIASVSAAEAVEALPFGIVRFTLEFREAPELGDQTERLAEVLDSRKFSLDELDPLLPQFLVLQFSGVNRTIAPPSLFAMADTLVEDLDLVSCVPDIATTFFVEPGDDPAAESVVGDAILRFTCWARENDSFNHDWAVRSIRADRAWAKTRGAGAVVAQPDTGVAEHVELRDALDTSKSLNVFTGSSNPEDPLTDGGNPGHGTATSSVVASREDNFIVGSAPEAKVVPIRCVNSVVLGIDSTPLAKAILHATRIEADVITMSLGGPINSPSMIAAIDRAVANGLIVLAAAGNCVQPIVVFPANYRNVIALAGVDINDEPWKGTSRGVQIDLAAPSENVWVARRSPGVANHTTVKPSQGTSFAVALTAGAAALWVSHHGRDAIRQAAAQRGVTVNDLFRTALKATARPPRTGNWNHRFFGAGIVDAEALLDLALDDIPHVMAGVEMAVAEMVADEPDALVNAVMELANDRSAEGENWARFGPEAVFLATDAWRRSQKDRAFLLESPRLPEPSPGLAAAMPAVLGRVLSGLDDQPLTTPPVVGAAEERSYVRSLGARGMSGIESSAGISESAAVANLKGDGLADLMNRFRGALDKAEGAGGGLERANLRDRAAERAEGAVRKLLDGRMNEMDIDERVTVEALVRLNDRPSFRVTDGMIDPNDPLFGEWGGFLLTLPGMTALTNGVGRIDIGGNHAGTGFVVGPGLVMTNRHVLEAIADRIAGPSGSRWFFGPGDATIDFSDTADGSRVFRIEAVAATGANEIHSIVNFDNLDLALLEVDTGGGGFPEPLKPISAPNTAGEMFTIGYPARPGTSSMIDPQTGQFSVEIAKRIGMIFNADFGRKYVSPGRIAKAVGGLAGDPHDWVFSHDATTFGGNSGSCVVQLGAQVSAMGLHFAGSTLTANFAHGLSAVRDARPALFQDLDIDWI